MGKTLQAPRRRGFSPSNDQPALAADRAVATVASEPAVPAPPPPPPAASEPAAGIPGVVAERALPSPVTVSVICPTFNRAAMHEKLYESFHKQDYPHKDLWVLDDTHVPSPFFSKCKDPAVHYVRLPQKKSIGAKRNQLIALSSGALIAHFDDDDHYGPAYLSSMVAALIDKDADFAKLAMWNEHRTRYVATLTRFPNQNSGEDYGFVQTVLARGLRTVQVEGCAEQIEHVLHGRNVSRKE